MTLFFIQSVFFLLLLAGVAYRITEEARRSEWEWELVNKGFINDNLYMGW